MLQQKPQIAGLLEKLLTVRVTPRTGVYISDAEDELRSAAHGFPEGRTPADYLETFRAFLAENMNRIPALSVIVQRPRALTREQLKEVRLALEGAEFRERDLKAAWRALTNEEIAVGIVGFIRRQAMGSPLVAYEERVDRALKKLLVLKPWTPPQRKWLELLARQLKQETVVDRASLDKEPFKDKGGFKVVDKAFDGHAEEVLASFHEAVWSDAA